MKTNLITLIAALLLALNVFAGEPQRDYFLIMGNHEIGGYVGTGGRYSPLFSDNAGFMDLKGAITIDGKWAVGLTGSALHYDKELNKLVNDGTYRLNLAYGGLFVERIFTLPANTKLSVSLMTGMGTAFYRYDKEYRKDKVWSEEYIDRTEFAVQELGLELQHRIGGNFWLGINGTLRNSSPLRLIDTDEEALRSFTGGVTLKYGIF